MHWFLISSICLARLCQAIRDAETFERPLENRSVLWHIMAFPWYLLTMFTGTCLTVILLETFNGGDLTSTIGWIALAFALQWFVFEISLDWLRMIFNRRF